MSEKSGVVQKIKPFCFKVSSEEIELSKEVKSIKLPSYKNTGYGLSFDGPGILTFFNDVTGEARSTIDEMVKKSGHFSLQVDILDLGGNILYSVLCQNCLIEKVYYSTFSYGDTDASLIMVEFMDNAFGVKQLFESSPA